jgi:integrase
MAKRRGNNEGSIYKMKDGRWRGAISVGWKTNEAGVPQWHRKTITGATRAAVQEEMKRLLRDQQRGINIDPEKKTVKEFLGHWLESIKRDVEPATYVSYEGAARLHISPLLGKIPLAKLTVKDVQRFKLAKLESVIEKGPGVKKDSTEDPRCLSARSVRYLMVVLRMALDAALKQDLVARNVAKLVAFPKVEATEMAPYTPAEAQRFLEAARSHRLGALFSVALALGLRKGEALGLRWPAIDLERGTLSVRQALQRVKLPGEKSQLLLKEPKRLSRRTLNLPAVILSELIAHRRRQEEERVWAGSRWKDTGFVFTTKCGGSIEPGYLGSAFSQIVKVAQLPRVRIHDLRHTAATLLLSQGVHAKVVAELLGHSRIAITLDLYSHVVPELRKEAAEKMDAALTPIATKIATKPLPETLN